MDEFPNLNMSIGEYYKLLMEGKRPTRQRTVKEEIKKEVVLGPPPHLRSFSSTAVGLGMTSSNPPMGLGTALGVRRDGSGSGGSIGLGRY
jgi:hypothetical protein